MWNCMQLYSPAVFRCFELCEVNKRTNLELITLIVTQCIVRCVVDVSEYDDVDEKEQAKWNRSNNAIGGEAQQN